MRRGRHAWLLVLALCLPASGSAAGLEVHGETDRFAGHGVALAWAVLRGATEAEAQAVVRVVPLDARLVSLSVDAVDPFSGERRQLLGRTDLGRGLTVAMPRSGFADHPRREFHLFTGSDERVRQPSLTIYYLGAPDTAPEFLAEDRLAAYLEATLATLRQAPAR
ncbi:MAG: hypothetical protein ACE147_08970 [Candidatus Methylomirabilales bacterium]